jgi:hypothetical protein
MAKRVGFTRTIKPHWLNKTVELASEGLNEIDIKEQLDEYLSFELKDKTNIGKARNILMNTWVYESEDYASIKEQALVLIKKYPEYSLELHWCMMLIAYPVFVDICKLIGKMAEFQDELTLKQIKQKLFDEWGESSTLFYSIDKLVATLKNLEVMASAKRGVYHIKKHKVDRSEIVNFMLYIMMLVDNSGYYSYVELKSSVYLFPFDYRVEKENLLEDERFVMNSFGGELSIAIKDRL